MNRKVKRYKPSIVQAPEHIPAEYKPIGQFHKTDPALHRQLNRLCDRQEVMAFRLGEGGSWFVHEDHIQATREQRQARREYAASPQRSSKATQFRVNGVAEHQCEAAVLALCEINNGITLMQATLERLTAAVESIATQPKARFEDATEASWTGINGDTH